MSGLTILTGMNGTGKSSVLHSMLLLRDTYCSTHQLKLLYLKGNSFSVGQTTDAVNYNCRDDKESLRYGFVTSEGGKYGLSYRYSSNERDVKLELFEKQGEIDELVTCSLFTDQFQYLSAFRIGPRSLYESDKEIVDIHHQLSNKMGRAEMTAYFLDKYGDAPLAIDSLCYDARQSHTLRHQVMLWMNEISNGIQVKIDQYGGNYEMRFGTERKGRKTIFHSAMNTGYGISYVLSIVVALLSADSGALILIENPEAHIHPSGQSALMRLVSLAAAAGVQVVIETHSDHIINGALVARKQELISSDTLVVYYFDRDDDGNALPIHLEIGKNGLIQNAPDHFFGQMNADLRVLFDLE
jgi:predicted ATPase